MLKTAQQNNTAALNAKLLGDLQSCTVDGNSWLELDTGQCQWGGGIRSFSGKLSGINRKWRLILYHRCSCCPCAISDADAHNSCSGSIDENLRVPHDSRYIGDDITSTTGRGCAGWLGESWFRRYQNAWCRYGCTCRSLVSFLNSRDNLRGSCKSVDGVSSDTMQGIGQI